jgi:ABC-type thiamin/hydroxymethylpyrimidine transport system permease subunit
MRAAPPDLAGAASGVLNTGRQLGATLGGAISGAVLATTLTSAMRSRALAAASRLPPAALPGFLAGFAHTASSGLQVGRGQAAATLPRGMPAALASRIERLIHDVFVQGYLAAMRPTLALSVALLLAGATACLLLRRHSAADETAEADRAAPAGQAGLRPSTQIASNIAD